MVSRATHYNNQRRHSQREFGHTKPRLTDRDQSSAWVGPASTALREHQGTVFNAEHELAVAVHDDPDTRLVRLRALSKIGVLRMSAHREDNQFIEYRWEVR